MPKKPKVSHGPLDTPKLKSVQTALRRSLPRKTPKRAGPKRSASGKRVFEQPKYRSFRVSPRIKHTRPKIIGSFRLLKRSFGTIKLNWKLFIGISIIYFILSLILVQGLGSSTNVQNLKDGLSAIYQGRWAGVASSFTVFGALLGTMGSAPTEVAGAYQTLLLLIVSLTFIWAFRQTLAGNKVKIREAFYKGPAPLIPFIVVLLVIGIQLLPVLFANLLYMFVFGNGLAVTAPEKLLWALLMILLALWSFYMITSSLFALYIVALPNMTPMKALRSARGLVRYRRWTVLRRVLFLPVALLLLLTLIIVPIIAFAAPATVWVFYIATMFSLMIIHSYMYNLYRELIQ